MKSGFAGSPENSGNGAGDRLAGLSPAKRALFERRLREAAASNEAIPRKTRTGPSPLSSAQQRIWMIDQLTPGTLAYNVPRAMRLRGAIDEDALQRALGAIVARHEILRTVYKVVEGNPAQVVLEAPVLEVRREDLGGLGDAYRAAAVEKLLIEDARRPFDLSRDMMLRATLVRLAEEDHVLLLVLHHIASDGWSKGVLLQELTALYGDFANGRPSSLPALPIQYADFADWQLRRLKRGELQKQVSFWKETLRGAPEVLELPADRARPAVQTYDGAKYVTWFPAELTQALKAMCQREGVSVFQALLAAFQILLGRYTGQSDVVVGTLVSGRCRPETEGLFGCFVNTLAVRGDLSGDPTLREMLGRARASALAAFDNQDVPFESLVAELRVPRDLSRSPLFQVGLTLDPPVRVPPIPGLIVEPFEVDLGVAKYELGLSISDDPGGLRAKVEYSTALFDELTIAQMVGHFQRLLEAMAADPGQRSSATSLLNESERSRIVHDWNDTAFEYPCDRCVHQRFEVKADQTPDALALKAGDETLTYRQLNNRANQLAHHLRARGVGPEVIVGVALERSAEMVVTLVAILKAGGAYLPLDPNYPRDRLAFMLEDSSASVLITRRRLAEQLPALKGYVLYLDSDPAVFAGDLVDNPVVAVTPENLAHMIYTSGSTGRPKGVQISHRALGNLLASMQWRPSLSAEDRLLAVTSISFDMAGLELFLPLMVGACVELATREMAIDGQALRRHLVESGATVMQATPGTWRSLVEAGWIEGKGFRAFCGGEALARELANCMLTAGASVWNMYGPTETTIYSLIGEVALEDGPVSIGTPIGNTQVYILDRNLRPVPVGVPGQIFIGGVGVARGYWNRPELTAERFIPDPFATTPGARLYLTGDLARYRRDGSVQYLGRLDDQVKVRGFRIELGEIEAVLGQHSSVGERAVLLHEFTPTDSRLVAYLVPREGVAPTTSDLRRFLGAKLPDYMVPAQFVVLDAMPRTPNGKLNRRALPAPEPLRPELEGSFIAPRNPIEEAVARSWADVLRIEKVGVHDNFFELGGHSLLAIRMMTRLRSALSVDLPLRSVFETPTVAGMADAVSRCLLDDASPDELALLLEEIGTFSPDASDQ